jgi:hypothetical protein
MEINDGRGKTSKMEAWVKKLKKVLNKENIIYLTDAELQFLVNKELPKKDRITRQCFENWKAGKFGSQDENIGEEFQELIQCALIEQKNNLFSKMMDTDDKNWTKIAWVLERKFSEWNLKHISENVNKNEQQTIIQISAGNDEQKNLIDNIINIDHFELPNEKLNINQNNVKDNDVEF